MTHSVVLVNVRRTPSPASYRFLVMRTREVCALSDVQTYRAELSAVVTRLRAQRVPRTCSVAGRLGPLPARPQRPPACAPYVSFRFRSLNRRRPSVSVPTRLARHTSSGAVRVVRGGAAPSSSWPSGTPGCVPGIFCSRPSLDAEVISTSGCHE